jgi:hypothetical protein
VGSNPAISVISLFNKNKTSSLFKKKFSNFPKNKKLIKKIYFFKKTQQFYQIHFPNRYLNKKTAKHSFKQSSPSHFSIKNKKFLTKNLSNVNYFNIFTLHFIKNKSINYNEAYPINSAKINYFYYLILLKQRYLRNFFFYKKIKSSPSTPTPFFFQQIYDFVSNKNSALIRNCFFYYLNLNNNFYLNIFFIKNFNEKFILKQQRIKPNIMPVKNDILSLKIIRLSQTFNYFKKKKLKTKSFFKTKFPYLFYNSLHASLIQIINLKRKKRKLNFLKIAPNSTNSVFSIDMNYPELIFNTNKFPSFKNNNFRYKSAVQVHPLMNLLTVKNNSFFNIYNLMKKSIASTRTSALFYHYTKFYNFFQNLLKKQLLKKRLLKKQLLKKQLLKKQLLKKQLLKKNPLKKRLLKKRLLKKRLLKKQLLKKNPFKKRLLKKRLLKKRLLKKRLLKKQLLKKQLLKKQLLKKQLLKKQLLKKKIKLTPKTYNFFFKKIFLKKKLKNNNPIKNIMLTKSILKKNSNYIFYASLDKKINIFFKKKNINASIPSLSWESLIALKYNNLENYYLLFSSPVLFKFTLKFNNNIENKFNILKIYNNFNIYSPFNNKLFINNILPIGSNFHWIIKKRLLNSLTNNTFSLTSAPLAYLSIIKFLEFSSGCRTYFKLNYKIHQFLNTEEKARCLMWSTRVRVFRKILGHRLFLNESIQILYLCLKLKDPFILSNWMLHMLYKISFWKHRLFFRYLQYLLRYFFWPHFPDLQLKGIKFQLKGKISVAGNARTRTLLHTVGATSHSTFNNKILYNLNLVKTFTGVMGFKTWISF